MGKIASSFGRVCQECDSLRNINIDKCVECFSQYIRPLEDGYCPNCLDPRHPDKQIFEYCWTCKSNLDNDHYHLDGILTCGYYIDKDGDFGFSLHTYKGSGMTERKWMVFPLAALAYSFLQRHFNCIKEKYGEIEVIVPIPGHAEKLLYFCNGKFPIVKCLKDTKTERQSTGGERGFNPARFEVIENIPKNILLFDDVLTRGGTAHSAAYTLKSIGARKVVLFSLAKRIGNTRGYLSSIYEPYTIERCPFC